MGMSRQCLAPVIIGMLLMLPQGAAFAAPPSSNEGVRSGAIVDNAAMDSGGGSADGFEDDFTDDFGDDFEDDFEDEDAADDIAIADPLEPFNRAMFAFNDKFYFYFLKPVARGYRVVPVPVRRSVARFFTNVQAPMRIANNFLQLKMKNTGTELLRFGINTTIGLLGFFDPARAYWGLRRKDEDFGQTLGHYGIGPGFYLVLPFYGSYTLRDGTGLLVDTLYLDPIYRYIDNLWIRLTVRGYNMVNSLSLDRDTYEALKRDALDPYAFVKNAYIQHRAAQIRE